MSLSEFINNEIDISKFKLSILERGNRRYKGRLAEVEREFLQIDFEKLADTEAEARDAINLFRVSRVSFYLKYKDRLSFIQNFGELKKSTLSRKRYILDKAVDLGMLISDDYKRHIADLFSYSDIVLKRQIARFEYGRRSLGMYIEGEMKKIYEEVNTLNEENILYARSLMDELIKRMPNRWYANYNCALSNSPFGKIKPLRLAIDRRVESKDIVEDGYEILTNIKNIGNEYVRIINLELLDKDGNDISNYLSSKLRGGTSSKNKRLHLNYLDSSNISPRVEWIRLLVPSTRSESISLESLCPLVDSTCDLISQEYHSF